MIYHIYSVQKKHNGKEAFFQWFDNYLSQLLGFHDTSGQLLTFKSTGGESDWDRDWGGRTGSFLNIFSTYLFPCK